jgi:hypothetical protein
MMKKFLFFLLLIISVSSRAQTSVYHSFPDSAFWRVDILVYSPMDGGCMATYYFHYYVSGDTLINSSVHKKIYKSFVLLTSTGSASPCDPIPSIEDSGYVGALKEDSILNRTFFVLPNYTNDTLLYDYNLIAGDTVKGFIGLNCMTILSSVDSVLINGQYRKRWNGTACGGNPNEYIIEGIGTSYGFIERFSGSPNTQSFGRLVCVKDTTNTLFVSTYSSAIGCQLIYSGESEISQENNVTISPNPFHSFATLRMNQDFENSLLNIYDAFGRLVSQKKNKSQTSIISREGLPNGIYFYQIKNNKGNVITGKLMIE